jgi:hypothetical protein
MRLAMPVLGPFHRHPGFALCVALVVSLVSASPAFAQLAVPDANDAGAAAKAPAAVAPAAPKVEAKAPKVEAPKVDTSEPAVPSAPKAEAPKSEAPKPSVPATPRIEAPEPPVPSAPKVEAPKVEAPKVEAPKELGPTGGALLEDTRRTADAVLATGDDLSGGAGGGGLSEALPGLDALGDGVSRTAAPVTGQLAQAGGTLVEDTRRTIDTVLATGGDLSGGAGSGGLVAGLDDAATSLTHDAFALMGHEGSKRQFVSVLGSDPTTGPTAGARAKAAGGSDLGRTAPVSPVAGGPVAPLTTPASSQSGTVTPPAAGGAPSPRRFDDAPVGAMPGGLGALHVGAGTAGAPGSTPPVAPERGPAPTDLPALGTSAGQGLAFTALLAILSLFVFAVRERGRVFGIPNVWSRARGFPSLIELPG